MMDKKLLDELNKVNPKELTSPEAKLLKETFLFEYDKKTIQPQEDGSITVSGIIQRADSENHNGRIYPFSILKRKIEDYMELIRESRAFGELDHADSPIVNMKNVSHMITDIWWEEKTVWGKVKIMPTTSGQDLITIIKCGGVPGISSRSLGSVQGRNGIDFVQDDLQIVCWDFVSEPSTHKAFMRLSEAKDYDPNKTRTGNFSSKSDRNKFSHNLSVTLDEILSLNK